MPDFRNAPIGTLPALAALDGFDKISHTLRRLDEEHRATAQRLYELREVKLDRAQSADTDSLAEAIRAGGPEPKGSPQTEKIEKEIAATQRREAALAAAVRSERDSFLTAVETRRPKWTAELAAREADARQAYATSIESLAAARQQWLAQRAYVAWLHDFPADVRLRLPEPPVRVAGTNQEPLPLSALLDALRAETAPPKPPAPPMTEAQRQQRIAEQRPRLVGAQVVGPGAG